MTKIVVVSTGNASPTRELCLASIRAQRGVEVEHRWIDVSFFNNPASVSVNQHAFICGVPGGLSSLDPDTIVALVDLDDWLADRHVLAHIAALHRAGAWITYGQYVTTEGQRGHCEAYPDDQYRRRPWWGSHLKTFRAGLYQRIRPADLDVQGAHDVAAMLPMLEMAGPDRVRFCHWVSYVYNIGNSLERTNPTAKSLERSEEARIRAMKPYERVTSL